MCVCVYIYIYIYIYIHTHTHTHTHTHIKIFGTKIDEVTGEWRRLHNEELYDLYSSSNIIRLIKSRKTRWAGRVACMGDRRGAYRGLAGRPEGKRTIWKA